MSFIAAYEAGIQRRFIESQPAKNAIKLREMPTRAPGPLAPRAPRKTRRVDRLAFDYRRWMPPDIESALSNANASGNLFTAATIAAWVKSHPIVAGVLEGRTSTPWLPPGVKYNDEASAWLLGTDTAPGWREKITDPSELEAICLDDFNAGYGLGCFVWNAKCGHPELLALDNAGLRYIPGEDRYQYHGWGHVFDVEPGNSVWVLKTRAKVDPWRDGAWHKIAYKICNSELAEMQRSAWMQLFGLPTALAVTPQGASDAQRLTFTQKIVGAALRVIGVTPGYDIKYVQPGAEGSDTFAQALAELERAVSILTWGTVGLIAGGSGFSNSDLFERNKAAVLEKEARKEARFENDQIWAPVLDWAYRAGKISKAARNACIVYNAESAAVIQQKATAADALKKVGYSDEEAQRRVGLEKHAMPGGETKQGDGADVKEALNGAQIASAVQIVTAIAAQQIPRDAGVAQLKILLNIDATQAEEMVGTAGAGFVAAIDGVVPPQQPSTVAPPEAREEDEPEPTYSEMVAEQLNSRGEDVCPCPNHADRYCPRCGIVRRQEVRDGQWASVWQPVRRRAA